MGQALAYSIMKHETSWSNTDDAMVQLWRMGTKGRHKMRQAVDEALRSHELRDFLEGMDAVVEEPEPIFSKGILRGMLRIFFWTLPNYRAR